MKSKCILEPWPRNDYQEVHAYVLKKNKNDVLFRCVIPGKVMWDEKRSRTGKLIERSCKEVNRVFVGYYSKTSEAHEELVFRTIISECGKPGDEIFWDSSQGIYKTERPQGKKMVPFLAEFIAEGQSREYKREWQKHTWMCTFDQQLGNVCGFFGKPLSDNSGNLCYTCWYVAQNKFKEPCRNCGNEHYHYVAFNGVDAPEYEKKEGLEPDCESCENRDLNETDSAYKYRCGDCGSCYTQYEMANFPVRDHDCNNCVFGDIRGQEDAPCACCADKRSEDCHFVAKDPTSPYVNCEHCKNFKNDLGMVICEPNEKCHLRDATMWQELPCLSCEYHDRFGPPCTNCRYNYKNQYVKKGDGPQQ